jgi:hypothetical protein
MTFKDIRYSVPYPKDAARPDPADGDEGPHASQLLLLKGITGSFRGGVLTALMVSVLHCLPAWQGCLRVGGAVGWLAGAHLL